MATRKKREAPPPAELESLRGELEGARPRPAYLLRGEERYFRERAIASLQERARALEWEVVSHSPGDPDFDAGGLLTDLCGGSLFGAEQLIVIRDADRAKLLDGTAKKPSALTQALCSRLASGEATGSVVIAVDKLRADHKLAKAIAAAEGRALSCRKLWDTAPPWDPDPLRTELALWVRARSKELGVRLDPRQSAYVAAATGNDLAGIDTQIEKLRQVGPQGLAAAVGWEGGGSPFALADELVKGDAARALSGIESLFRGGFADKSGKKVLDTQALCVMLTSALVKGARAGLAASRRLEAGASPQDALRAAGHSGAPQRGEELLAKARSASAEAWRRRLDEASTLERRIKTGSRVDASDLCALALRWEGDRKRDRQRGGAPRRTSARRR